ncbi:MAG: hypothetical protein QG585_555 [Patescibacteria group bacterium]|jgi:Tol biopolymer transport system component|nr:hypothetical protein [Patescibacteria group bacterium]
MLRKIIFGLIILILILGGILFFLFKYQEKRNPEVVNQPFSERVSDIFPVFNNEKNNGDVSSTTEEVGESIGIDITVSTTTENERVVPRLRLISKDPVSGATIIETTVSSTTPDGKKFNQKVYVARFMDRATGHVFDLAYNSNSKNKISNTTIPKIHEALFSRDAKTIITRFLSSDNEVIKTYSIALTDRIRNASTTPEELMLKDAKLTLLPTNIKEVSLSPDKTKIAYLINTNTGSKVVVSSLDGVTSATVFESDLKQWLLSWQETGRITLSTKPSGFSPGFSYLLNSGTGALSKIIGNKTGLTILSSTDLSYHLLGTGGQRPLLSIFNPKDQTETSLSLRTFPEKCTWGKTDKVSIFCFVPSNIENSTYPEGWYLGAISFSDNLWNISAPTGQTNLISSPVSEAGAQIDAINPILSNDDKYLIFTNKKDLSLWAIYLGGEKIIEATSTPRI